MYKIHLIYVSLLIYWYIFATTCVVITVANCFLFFFSPSWMSHDVDHVGWIIIILNDC